MSADVYASVFIADFLHLFSSLPKKCPDSAFAICHSETQLWITPSSWNRGGTSTIPGRKATYFHNIRIMWLFRYKISEKNNYNV